MNCIIIEDNKGTVAMLKTIINNAFHDITISGSASTIESGIQLIKTASPDFILVDVNLEDGEAFSILREFPKPKFQVVFITSYSKYAVDAFKFSALDFILKPFSPDDVVQAIHKIIEERNQKSMVLKLETFFHNQNSQNKKIILSDSDNIHVISIENILFATSNNSYTIFTLKNKNEIVVSKSLKSFDQELTPYSFVRIHQKFLVNTNFISKFHKKNNEVVLTNGNLLPVSKTKKEQLMRTLKNL